jgi:hypothetical protein
MRSGQPIISRPAWYDRNAVSKAAYYINTLAPHSETVRLSYTCPTGRKAIVEFLVAKIFRTGAANTPAAAKAAWKITPAGGSAVQFLKADLWLTQNATGDKDYYQLSLNLVLCSGDKIEGVTSDDSTGGTIGYVLGYKLSEFDA